METVGRIICYGSRKAPDLWDCTKHVGINRLYYIHGGTGGYIHKGKRHAFSAGTLYYIPYTADFTPFCEKDDPIMHTYIDFELIPPIISDEIVSLCARHSDAVAAATELFVLGGKRVESLGESAFFADAPLWEMCKASILFLTNTVTGENGLEKIKDKTVIRALECMHTRMRERLTVNEIARECYMNPDSFIRHFSQVVGVTPYAYLKNLRLITARYLRESGMSLAQIASETGYADASSLSHALKSEC